MVDAQKFDQASEFKLSSREFTDFTGFQSDNPTGIIQQEFTGTVFRQMTQKDLKKIYTFRGVSLNILFNRIDKSNNTLNYPVGSLLANGGTNPYVAPFMTTMDIFKYSNTQFGINVPVLFFKPSTSSTLSLNYGFSVIRNKPYYSDTIKYGIDSGNNSSNLRPTYSFANKLELEYQTKFTGDDNGSFGISAKVGLMYISLKDSYYRQFDAASIDPYNKITALASTSSSIGGSQPIIYSSICLEKLMGANKENSVFFRLNYYFQSGKYNAAKSSNVTGGIPAFEERNYYNHFMQVQTGVTLDVGKLFGVSTPATATNSSPVSNSLQ